MNKLFFYLFIFPIIFLTIKSEAVIQVNQFVNESDYSFEEFSEKLVIDSKATFDAEDGDYKIILEDAGHSGYHRPHWKFNVWLQSANKFPLLKQDTILYAVVFYDGLGEIELQINKDGELNVIPGSGVKKIIYPWSVATIGRGNPYHNIPSQVDQNRISYFDHYGFVRYSNNRIFLDDQCESFDNHNLPKEINYPQ